MVAQPLAAFLGWRLFGLCGLSELFGLFRLFGHGVDRRLGGSGRVGWGVGGGGGGGVRVGRRR
ncbi:MAG: hypothetical protein DIU83_11385, partial [Bacillota bacterium]